MEADAAVERAAAAFREWSGLEVGERATVLQRAAGLMRERRLELAALAVLEAGKPWAEADGDVCEAIDFLEYYAVGSGGAGAGTAADPASRRAQHAALLPAGRLCGDRTVELSAGDPDRDDRRGARHRQHRRLQARGADARVRSRCRGGAARRRRSGRRAAARCAVAMSPLRRSSRTRRCTSIAFTGSVAAGLSIIRVAAEQAPGQHHIKRVIAEMGGKNCVIVDADADLDDAVPAIVKSAFGFAGQKCSAAARVLVHRDIADALERAAGGRDRDAAGRARPRTSPPIFRPSSTRRPGRGSAATCGDAPAQPRVAGHVPGGWRALRRADPVRRPSR